MLFRLETSKKNCPTSPQLSLELYSFSSKNIIKVLTSVNFLHKTYGHRVKTQYSDNRITEKKSNNITPKSRRREENLLRRVQFQIKWQFVDSRSMVTEGRPWF